MIQKPILRIKQRMGFLFTLFYLINIFYLQSPNFQLLSFFTFLYYNDYGTCPPLL